MHDLAAQPLLTAEFLAVDTETNGLGKDLLRADRGRRGAGRRRRAARALELAGRRLAAAVARHPALHRHLAGDGRRRAAARARAARAGGAAARAGARRAQRALRRARAAPGLRPRARSRGPTRRSSARSRSRGGVAPLQRRRGLAALADALGIEVEGVAPRAARRGDVRARVLRAVLEAVRRTPATVGEAVALLERAPRRAAARPRTAPAKRPRAHAGPDISGLPKDPGVYVFRNADGRPLYVGKSVCLRTRARAHFTTPGDVDRRRPSTSTTRRRTPSSARSCSRTGSSRRSSRRATSASSATPDGYVYLRCRFDIPFPILEVAREPAAGHSVTVGPLRGRAARGRARRAAQLAVRPAPLRAHAAAPRPSLRLRADGPLPVAVPARPRPQPLPRAPRRGARACSPARTTAPRRCSTTSRARCARPRPSAATSARPGCAAATRGCARCSAGLGGVLRAIHAGSRLVLAPHPSDAARHDAFWVVGGRVVDWGPLPEDPAELAARTADALRAAPRPELGGWLRPEEIDEARIVGLWLAAHDDARVRELRPGAEDPARAGAPGSAGARRAQRERAERRLLALAAAGRSAARGAAATRRASRRGR